MTPLAIFLLGCATVFFGAIQAAFSALMRLSLRLMAERGGRSDRLGHYLDDPMQLFVPLRLLLGICIVAAGVLIARVSDVRDATSIAVFVVSLISFVVLCEHVLPMLDATPIAVFVVSLISFVVVCEHVLPMLIVRTNPEQALDLMLPVFHVMARALLPVTLTIIRIFGPRRDRESGNGGNGNESETEAPPNAAESAADDAISDEEGRELLQSIVDFTETVAREVMTPRPDIVAVHVDTSLADLRALFREEQYSRMPVYRDSLDNILGIVFVKDLVALPPDAAPPMTTLMRSAHFVPESKRVSELLKEMQRRQLQMAIVVDEYGGTAGLVTLEDLLEEIVGEIRDEYDVESETVTDEGNGVFAFSGKVNVDEVRERLGVDIEREGFETVGGFLLSQLGRMPYVGEIVEIDELVFEVLEVERRRITKVRVRRRPEPAREP